MPHRGSASTGSGMPTESLTPQRRHDIIPPMAEGVRTGVSACTEPSVPTEPTSPQRRHGNTSQDTGEGCQQGVSASTDPQVPTEPVGPQRRHVDGPRGVAIRPGGPVRKQLVEHPETTSPRKAQPGDYSMSEGEDDGDVYDPDSRDGKEAGAGPQPSGKGGKEAGAGPQPPRKRRKHHCGCLGKGAGAGPQPSGQGGTEAGAGPHPPDADDEAFFAPDQELDHEMEVEAQRVSLASVVAALREEEDTSPLAKAPTEFEDSD